MEKILVGKKDFGKMIDVTDPGFDKEARDRVNNIPFIEGRYNCYAITDDKDQVVSICIEPDYMEELVDYKYIQIGTALAGSGMVGFFSDKPDYTEDQWADFLLRMEDHIGSTYITDYGFFSESGIGTGVFPVYIAVNKQGVAVSSRIDFVSCVA